MLLTELIVFTSVLVIVNNYVMLTPKTMIFGPPYVSADVC